MEKRRGPSISVKMILTTTAIIVIIVAGFGVASVWRLNKLFEQNEQVLRAQTEKNLADKGLSLAAALAGALKAAFLGNDWNNLQGSIPDVAKKDNQIAFLYVAEKDGRIQAASDVTRNGKGADDAAWHELASSKDTVIKSRLRVGAEDALVVGSPVVAAGQVLGYIVAGYSLKFLDQELENLRRKRNVEYQSAWLFTALIGLIAVLLGTATAVYQGFAISKPIKMLARGADEIARGHLEKRVPVASSDEIGLLGENFNYMADRLVVLLRETADKATLEKELEVARAIQDALVPPADTVDRRFIKLAGFFQPATQCGGDWWTYHDLVEGKVLVVIGDVTGHGVPSAMITAAAKAACDTVRAITNDNLTVTYLLEILNRAIFESAKRKFVMTCFASIIDPKTRTITYANAGHNFPYLYRQVNGRGQFGCLMTRGNRLGDLQESKYTAKQMELVAGDVLVWYTDGIVECENDRGEEFGEKRFRAAIRRAATLDPAEMRESVVTSANQFFGDRPRKDDITMVLARIYG
jgi:serine phosphatase RsbU (regulator of sigma subunit)